MTTLPSQRASHLSRLEHDENAMTIPIQVLFVQSQLVYSRISLSIASSSRGSFEVIQYLLILLLLNGYYSHRKSCKFK